MNIQNFLGAFLRDNCGSHVDEHIKQLRAERRIRLIRFPPHTSHLFQPSDLATFAGFKREKEEIYVIRLAGSQVWEITKLIKALEYVTHCTNNRAPFRDAGLTVNPRMFPLVVLMDSTKLNGLINTSSSPEIPEVHGGIGPSANGS
jgi:hypothetical protein